MKEKRNINNFTSLSGACITLPAQKKFFDTVRNKDLNLLSEDSFKKQKELNESLTKELENLKKSFDHYKKFYSLGKLVGSLVHEINNPLDGVIRYVNLAFDRLEEDGITKEYLEEVKRGLNRIAKLVKSLLDFSWSLSPQEGTIDINQTIEESLYMLNHWVIAYNITVEKFYNPDLPKLPDYRLKLVCNNIIKNACQAMKQGGTLNIYTALYNGYVEIRFKDTGEGISEDIQDKIFDPFFTTKSMGEGSGLGLAICYEIVQRYKGNISVESYPKKGTTFIIHLPKI